MYLVEFAIVQYAELESAYNNRSSGLIYRIFELGLAFDALRRRNVVQLTGVLGESLSLTQAGVKR